MKNKLLIAVLALAAAVMIAAHLHVPHSTQLWKQQEPAASARFGESLTFSLPQGAVDVNSASAQELTALWGVGPSLAQAIIAEREQNGPFHYPEDLLSVKGIGEKTLKHMLDQLRLP